MSAEELPLIGPLNKPPRAYVKVTFQDYKLQTQMAGRSIQPFWNKGFQLWAESVYLSEYNIDHLHRIVRNRSSAVSFEVIHESHLAFMKGSSLLGVANIEIGKLLERCQNNKGMSKFPATEAPSISQ